VGNLIRLVPYEEAVSQAASIRKSRARSAPARKIIYLACPYTDADASIRQLRFDVATGVAADLIRTGHIVYSPITMTHPIDIVLAGESNTLGSDYWVAFDEAFMEMCSEMVVIRLAGWQRSSGIRREIAYFTEHKKPIRYIDPPYSVLPER
jgi:Domain of unknown function (DUF1937)